MKSEVKMNKLLYDFAHLTLGRYITKRLRVTYIGQEEITQVCKPPYIILANHTNFWDPVLVAKGLSDPIYYITSDNYFRNPLLKKIFKSVGAIPKTKFFSDSQTVKDIIKVKNQNGIIGIFPEGRRNWDGTTLEILFPTAKLVKSLKIPVVIALAQGAALTYPRWASSLRTGELTVTYKVILTGEEINSLSVDQVYDKLCSSLAHDEYDWQKERMISYTGTKLAERLELFLFTCPHCQKIGFLKSADDRLACDNCDYTVRYNQYGFFEQVSEKFYFSTPREWNLWQLNILKDLADSKDLSKPLFQDQNLILKRGQRMSPLKKYREGSMVLYPDRLHFSTTLGEELIFPIDEIQGANIQYNDQLEFYHQKTLYRFIFTNKSTSAYKWKQAIEFKQNVEAERGIV